MKHIPRIYIQSKIGKSFSFNEKITLDIIEHNHLKNVMRLKDNSNVIVFNDKEEWDAKIKLYNKNSELIISTKIRDKKSNDVNIHIFFSIFKKQEFLIEKATEIGADFFHPVISDFSASKEFNLERCLKISKQALEQSNRIDKINFLSPIHLNEISQHYNFPILACIERKKEHHILQKMFDIKQTIKQDIGILIGPEGGFSENEILSIQNFQNLISSSLGENILRSETAGIFALSIVKSFFSI